jgi:hypothetical protein
MVRKIARWLHGLAQWIDPPGRGTSNLSFGIFFLSLLAALALVVWLMFAGAEWTEKYF